MPPGVTTPCVFPSGQAFLQRGLREQPTKWFAVVAANSIKKQLCIPQEGRPRFSTRVQLGASLRRLPNYI